MKSTTHRLHTLSVADIPDLIALSDSVGWDYDEAEIRTILSIGTVFGHKDDSDRIVSSAAIIEYEEGLATIGMVIVHSSCRGLGYGRDLMEACMKAVSGDTAIMLIATPDGEPLYQRLGFVTATHIHKFLRRGDTPVVPPAAKAVPYQIASMDETDLERVVELDQGALGSRRSLFVQMRKAQAARCLVAKDASGTVVGYGFAVQGPINLIAGPIVARDADMAIQLLCALIQNHDGQVRIDVPDGPEAFLAFLEQNGFQKASRPPVMVANAKSLPQRNGSYFAIGAQIYG
ncbi:MULTISPECIES: GNAT family N-acetyltransferase [Brevibacillus]|uniref:GNAT family N-acetyltransferase n=1 Tax=Brevibacillus TaxID=55080 RepID=UPI002474BFF7|nr:MULTISPECIES: GNAT family N-acetyltransferase [Brevibacillus]MDH6352949.1 GNAT superfamily N-acetyltransferase [Brevibacillus sp. 1238]MED2253091.1 GNAT family N-acetyltransferase [Brevibacillus parabrevis]